MTRLLLLVLLLLTGAAIAAAPAPSLPGFLVAAPDRGFTGTEEIRDAFAGFADGRNAELVFVTDARGDPVLGNALPALHRRGAAPVGVLPGVVFGAEPHP